MRPRQLKRYASVAGLACAAAVALAVEADAQEYCVGCNGPDAVYRCVIDNAVPQGVPLKMLCLDTLAREGGHATCAVRGGTVFDCNGPIRRIDPKAASQALAKPPSSAPVNGPPASGQPVTASAPGAAAKVQPPPAQTDQKPKVPPGDEPPKTVEELAKRVSKSSGDSLGKAGSAISDQASKAWGCLTSLFKSC